MSASQPLDAWRHELNVEPIRHGQNGWYGVLAEVEFRECVYDFVANHADPKCPYRYVPIPRTLRRVAHIIRPKHVNWVICA